MDPTGLVRSVGFLLFDFFRIGGLVAHGFLFGRVFKFLDGLAKAFGERREFGTTEENQ